ncbi:hypothetical protein GGE07_003763 [Sinorhizobium terangae]|uniref:ABC transporter substrate-binding protein n=1 Tax=Sinorhizobium terangae TaxID=110322 RepID=A0A6N7LDC1_SINTE|nr:hypothetical protein [Sinorhizobium terangae]MBB4187099.1 hypothetical protein [Sinorhizobium terangae]MQX15616.1 hypothetical protein [Sinorhizobium terangae]
MLRSLSRGREKGELGRHLDELRKRDPKNVQEKSPIVIMFQAATQVATKNNVAGNVNGATSDFVSYRLVKKN